ncbi:hypothetical protein PIB30_053490 [Stylosanthes scabra]|uniref:Uncharacterized protein n=1 Tax=Stylosanthes scabra TaxID=79078 RepID=A0ABU6YKY2_9FABA|nr:hypothetical protein [Stylosanthes scabra]
MEIKAKESEMDMKVLDADPSRMSDSTRARHEKAYTIFQQMARNFDDLFNEALHGSSRRRQRNSVINDWMEECLREGIEEEQEIQNISLLNPRRFINRNRESGHDRLYEDYFADELVYNADIF